MKETIHVNIGSMAFTLDEDAYRVLDRYFADIRSRLPEEDTETMADIESRVAEIFRERVSSPMRVISLEVVRATMAQMGSPADFGEPRTPTGDTGKAAVRHLYRSRSNRSIAGICGGLADYFGLKVFNVRLALLLLILFAGLSLWVYIILWLIVPLEPNRQTL